MNRIEKPNATEYRAYASMYIDLVPDEGLVLQHLDENFKKLQYPALSFSKESLVRRHAEDKWSIKEMLVHIMDDERIYAYRVLRFARNVTTELPGFEQDSYVAYSKANHRNLASILEEYETVR